MQERRREDEIPAEPLVQLRRLADERRHADRVLEQAARVGVVRLGRGQLAQRLPQRPVAEEAADDRRQPGCELSGEELEEAVELVRVAAQPRRQRILVRGLDEADLELEPVVEALDAAEHAHGVALHEAPVEQLDVVPDPPLGAAGRVDELDARYGAPLRVVRRFALPA